MSKYFKNDKVFREQGVDLFSKNEFYAAVELN